MTGVNHTYECIGLRMTIRSVLAIATLANFCAENAVLNPPPRLQIK